MKVGAMPSQLGLGGAALNDSIRVSDDGVVEVGGWVGCVIRWAGGPDEFLYSVACYLRVYWKGLSVLGFKDVLEISSSWRSASSS